MRELRISVVKSRRTRIVTRCSRTWEEFADRLCKSKQTGPNHKKYLALTPEEQLDLKDVGGYICGHYTNDKRDGKQLEFRSCLSLDIDHADPGTVERIKEAMQPYAWCLTHTHKSSDGALRYRWVLPLLADVPVSEYEPIARMVASKIGMDVFDDVTFQQSRIMFWASHSSDSKPFALVNEGRWINPKKVLAQYQDHTDVTSWPFSSRQNQIQHRGRGKAQDPRRKAGPIGTFCRAYSIEGAMATFLPGLYKEGLPGRFTYSGSTSSNGAVLYDDGTHLWSNHESDPIFGMNCNAYDLVRIHKFTHGEDMSEEESVNAMMKLISDDPVCQEEEKQSIMDAFGATEEDSAMGATEEDVLYKAIQHVEKAIEKLSDDPGAVFKAKAIKALKLLRLKKPAEYQRCRAKCKKKKVSVTELDRLTEIRPQRAAEKRDQAASEILIAMTQRSAELFTDNQHKPFACFTRNDCSQTWALDTREFRQWLSYQYYDRYHKAPREQALKDAITTLAGIATHEGKCQPVYLRAAPNNNGDGYYLDLVDEQWQVVEINKSGYQVLEQSPVKFWRNSNMQSLPMPEPGGSINMLWEFLNIPEEDRLLVVVWLLEAFRTDTPYPILEIGGEQGSAKSTAQEYIRMLIDPSAVNLRAAPKTIEDLFVAAGQNYVVSYNNLSYLTREMQDALCTLATGGGYAGRTLYTNEQETLWETKRPVVYNGITSLASSPDLVDRIIRLSLPPVEEYKNESEMKTAFKEKYGQILGALFQLLSDALAHMFMVGMDHPPRLVDFARLGEATYIALGTDREFMQDYGRIMQDAVNSSLEASPVAGAIQAHLHEENGKPLEGTVKEVMNQFSYAVSEFVGDYWPKTPKAFANQLRRVQPYLRSVGIEVEKLPRSAKGNRIRIYSREIQ